MGIFRPIAISSFVLTILYINCTPAERRGVALEPPSLSQWILSPKQSVELAHRGGIVIDARHYAFYLASHYEGATSMNWKGYAREGNARGLLQDCGSVRSRIEQSIFPVKGSIFLVYGDAADGWGEEGRIVWMLRQCHYPAYMVDGGYRALMEAYGVADESDPAASKSKPKTAMDTANLPSNDAIEFTNTEISLNQLQQWKDRSDVSILDVRESREFNGQTPYGESRGGHIPGAISLYYKELLNNEGFVRSAEEIRALLKSRGVNGDKPIVAYCTGGIRSSMATVILRHYGYEAYNFAGSMWLWSAQNSERYPLVH